MRLLQTVVRWSICRDLSCQNRVFALVVGLVPAPYAAVRLEQGELGADFTNLADRGAELIPGFCCW
jgi:hypothetical protein